jgi:hypothetical protein
LNRKVFITLLAVFFTTLAGGVAYFVLIKKHKISAPPSSPPLIDQVSVTPKIPAEDQSSSANVPTLATKTTGWKTYHSQKYGFTIQYPPDWSVLKPETDIDELEIASMQNTIIVSVFDFHSSPSKYASSFQSWVNEYPYALIKFKGRRALRWYASGVNISRTEDALIPSQDEGWAIFIHMVMNDKDAPSNPHYVRIFDRIIDSLNFSLSP